MYQNGCVPAEALVEVQPGIHLSPITAAAWNAMRAAAAGVGITLTVAVPFGGYRALAAQREIMRLGSYSGISTASAGHSTHGFGTRVDVANWYSARAVWVLANMGRFGFTLEFGTADPNHLKQPHEECCPYLPHPIQKNHQYTHSRHHQYHCSLFP